MKKSVVMSILVDKRTEAAVKVQEILTSHGCSIHARFGLHEAGGASCSEEGIIILYLIDSEEQISSLEKSLGSVKGVVVKSMQIR